MSSPARSQAARAWQHLYKTARWLRLRAAQLAREPLCQRCKLEGRVRAARIVHHVERHEGDVVKFFEGRLESLCKTCHDQDAQQQEVLGFSTRVGIDGWPVDPMHPCNNDGKVPPRRAREPPRR